MRRNRVETIASILTNPPGGKYVASEVIEDPHFEITKKILTQKNNLTILEELVIDHEKDYRISRQKGKFTKHLTAEELYSEFKPLIPEITSFLGAKEDYHFDVAILTAGLKKKIRQGAYYGLPITLGLAGALSTAALLKKKITRRSFLAGIAAVAGASLGLTSRQIVSHYDTLDLPEYNGRYLVPLKTAIIMDAPRETQLPILIHEYTHLLQANAGIWSGVTIIDEGHAKGVASLFATKLAEKTKNPAYLERVNAFNASEITQVYLWSCAVNNKSPAFKKDFTIPLAAHSLGGALFLLAERKLGTGIYKDVLNSDLRFLEGLGTQKIV